MRFYQICMSRIKAKHIYHSFRKAKIIVTISTAVKILVTHNPNS
uniref:Uncharacterized protein n=1 Tax=Arundo donax TaxID=35708 RepID=A0A0A9C6G9_ARUDO